jgi:serine/alanine racemase
MLKGSVNQLPKDQQYYGIDVIKFLCAILICMIHILPFETNAFGLDRLNFWLQNYICRIAVPFYFASSGFLLFRKVDFKNLNSDIIKNYCFKLFRLLGIWSFLLCYGGTFQLWYLGSVILAVIIFSWLLKKGVPLRYIAIIATVAFLIGLLGNSYYAFIEPLKNYFLPKLVISGYETIFSTTRNGLFFGFMFVFVGALFAKKRIVINNKLAIIGFIISMIAMFFEVYLLRHFSNPKSYDMYLSLIPVIFFMFYIATHIKLKGKPFYRNLRVIGVLVFFSHLFVTSLVSDAIMVIKYKTGVDFIAFRFLISVFLTIIIAIIINKLSQTKKFSWLKYLYS